MAISWSDMLWLAATATGDARYRLGAAPLAEPLRARIDAQTVFNSWTRGRRTARTAANSSWGATTSSRACLRSTAESTRYASSFTGTSSAS
jgi:hypothetical protein